ncbi:crol alpha [Paraphaeosphaeria sporulosa]
MPQYTPAQIHAYYQQYGCYPAGYQPPQQTPQVPTSAYGYPQGTTAYGHPSTSHEYYTPVGSAQQVARTWKCELPNCTSTANFTRLADLQRHQSTVHGVGTPDFPCTVKDCTRVGDKGFTRRDHLVEHLRNFHHIDIPKRRPGERSAYPLGLPNYQ